MLAACRRSNCTLTRTMNGRICAAAPLALAKQLQLPTIVQRGIAAVSSDRSTRPLPLPLFLHRMRCVAVRCVAACCVFFPHTAGRRNATQRILTYAYGKEVSNEKLSAIDLISTAESNVSVNQLKTCRLFIVFCRSLTGARKRHWSLVLTNYCDLLQRPTLSYNAFIAETRAIFNYRIITKVK